MAKSSVVPELRRNNQRGWRLWLAHTSMYRAALTAAIVAITGCAVPRTVTVTPAVIPQHHAPAPSPKPSSARFTLAATNPAAVNAPASCDSCVGVGYSSDVSIPVEITAEAFVGQVALSMAGLPSTVIAPSTLEPAPIALGYGNAGTEASATVQLYVAPGAAPGIYPFSVVGTPVTGSNSTEPESLPLFLTITSAASAGWQ